MPNKKIRFKFLRTFSLLSFLALLIIFIISANPAYAAEPSGSDSSIELEDYMFGSKLTGLSKILYDRLLVSASTVSTDPIEIPVLEYNISESQDDYVFSLSNSVLDYIGADFPYYEWMYLSPNGGDTTATWISCSNSYITKLKIMPVISPYYDSTAACANSLAKVNSKLNEILLSMPKSANTRYKRLEYIHDYLVDTITYDNDAVENKRKNYSGYIGQYGYAWEAYGALIKKTCVCEGYSKAFKLACDKLDIPCHLVSGDAGGDHMWNIVQMEDGKWYAVDVTFDDPIYSFTPDKNQVERDKNAYFLIGSNTMNTIRTAHKADNNLPYPTLSKTDYNISKQVEEPLVIYEGYLQDRYLGASAATLVCEKQSDTASEKTITEPSNETSESSKDTPKKSAKPTINYNSKKIYVNKKVTLKIKNLSAKAVVTFKSLNPKIAKVSKKGKVTGLRKGTATIRTTVKQGGKTYIFKTKIKVRKAN